MTELLDALDDGTAGPQPDAWRGSPRPGHISRPASDGVTRRFGDHAFVVEAGDASGVLERLLGPDRPDGRRAVIVVVGDATDVGRWAGGTRRPLEVDPRTGEARVEGRIVPTSRLESDVLRVLAGRQGCVVTRDEIIGAVWRDAPEGKGGNLDNALLRLRRKLEIDPTNPRHIVTVWGKGLLLQAAGA